MMNRFLTLVFTVLLISSSGPPEYDIVFQNVGLFDGYQDRGVVNIAIKGDTIAAITSEALAGNRTIDGRGKYVIPGMVNAHVHVSSIENLRTSYSLGILTLLNMHTGMEKREHNWKKISKDSAGLSRLYGAGHAATAPGGHPNQYSPDMETVSDSISIKEWVDHRIENNADYIKIVRDHHEWMGSPPLPTLSYDQIKQIIDYAHSRGYKAVVHANTVDEMSRIAEFGPDGFVHMLDYKEDLPIPDSFYQTLATRGIFVVTTSGVTLKPMENMPPFLRDWVTNNLLDSTQRAGIIKEMHENGIMIVAGTDAQQGSMNFGADYFLELELYEQAGLSNTEILRTATGNASKAFGLPIGELKVGSNADMVLLSGSPINDLGNLRKVEQVWKNGETK
ncbi:amidohydrolase family protein [Gramella sp. KN1008]|uniref:amidohydrolase family protein n=1 Tax=Gramella sp. KN1008 TaxID=2529298 RepID=UPI00103E6CEC|nr:amidohydrolase family protein [Gramella sp. KN1008]TBW29981.1 hypothetical protein EZJ28_00830 [Gramella sp. KN1008]